tara:strand:+ start:276 stop:587 length:312 start_codon:yes stop_codon:yes gene_type:complete
MSPMLKVYAEYGTIGLVCALFAYMIMNLIKSQNLQNQDLDQIRQAIAKIEGNVRSTFDITIKLIDRLNRSDETTRNYRNDIIKELNNTTDGISYLKGRANGKS